MTDKTKKYILIAFACLVVILLAVSAIAYFSGMSYQPVLGAAGAAAVAAAAASQSRKGAQEKVDEAKVGTETVAKALETQKAEVREAVEEAETDIKAATPSEKAKMGEDLLGPGGDS